MDDLSIEQRRALQQLREITNGDDDDFAIGVLSSVDWDVQVCLAQISKPLFSPSASEQPSFSLSQPRSLVLHLQLRPWRFSISTTQPQQGSEYVVSVFFLRCSNHCFAATSSKQLSSSARRPTFSLLAHHPSAHPLIRLSLHIWSPPHPRAPTSLFSAQLLPSSQQAPKVSGHGSWRTRPLAQRA